MKKIFKIGNQDITLIWKQFDDINLDKLLKIDHRNIAAEIITFPVVLNRLAMMVEDAINEVREAEIDLERYRYMRIETIRNELNDIKQFEKLTQDDIKVKQSAQLQKDKPFRAKTKKLLMLEKHRGYMKSIYWSAKDKSDKLLKLTDKQHPDDLKFQLERIEDDFNGVLLSKSKKYI